MKAAFIDLSHIKSIAMQSRQNYMHGLALEPQIQPQLEPFKWPLNGLGQVNVSIGVLT